MKILYIGEAKTHSLYKDGIIPSHWLYGAVEMEKEGHNVIWGQESTSVLNDVCLILKSKPDAIFIPNLNVKSHIVLLLLAWLHVCRIPIYSYLHHAPKENEGIKSKIFKLTLNSLRHVFFLSELSMAETIKRGFINKDKCSLPGWGPDRAFYDSVETTSGDYFVSTGKENRDFNILIEAFRRTGAPLKIMTAKSHAGSDYTDLVGKCKGIPNIEILITENSGSVFPQMLHAMAHAKAIVCPLRQDKLDYCVGLSTITDAEGLHKPLLITRNPYHSIERIEDYNVVTTIEDWVSAINNIKHPATSHFSMRKAYENMKLKMDIK